MDGLPDMPAMMRIPGADEEIPRQQPQQQQQVTSETPGAA